MTFGSAYEQFHNGVTQSIACLDGMSTYPDKAAAALQQTDRELAQALE
jgi:uncharacterized protein YukE